MANKALSKFFFYAFIVSCVVLFSACGGPEPVDNDGGQVSADGGQNDGGTIYDSGLPDDGGQPTNDGGTYDGGLIDDGGADAGVDGGNPLAEYRWIAGQWQETLFCTTVLNDGGLSNCQNRGRQPVAVSVVSWDDVNGATVTGFNPMTTIYVKKNTETSTFEIHYVYERTGGTCEGTAEQATLKMKMKLKMTNTSEWEYYEWEKQ